MYEMLEISRQRLLLKMCVFIVYVFLKMLLYCTSFSVIYYIFHIFQVLIMYKIKRVGIV